MKRKQGKPIILWNNNHRMSSSFVIWKNHHRRVTQRRMNTEYGGKMKWNYNNRLTSSPILKRHRKKKMKKKMLMDDDLIGKGRTTTTTTTTISDLPEEVLTHILVRLSAKDIVASCLSVQKSWDSLIKDPIFKTLHSNYQKNIINPNKKYLLFWDVYKTESYKIRLDDIQCEEHRTLKYPPDLEACFLYQLVSNGLICLFNSTLDHEPVHLWNPVIQKYKTLPPSPHPPCSSYTQGIAFGFVSQIDDYLVVYMAKYGLENKPHTMTCVYSLSANSWKTITHVHADSIPNIFFISQYNSVFVNGVAIWAGGNSRGETVLVCFDTKTELLRQILLPHWLEGCRLNYPVIHAFDQSVAYFVEDDKHGFGPFGNQLGAWVLKGDPMNEFSWEKKMMVALHRDVIVSVMGVRNNGEPILCNEYDLISYNLDTHKSYDFVKSWDSWAPSFWPDYWDDDCDTPFVITPFEESLGLLDVDCTQY